MSVQPPEKTPFVVPLVRLSEKAKEFASVDHLNPEVVAAFVDCELSPVAAHRAKIHLVHCAECRREVERQRLAADRLRKVRTAQVHVSGDLLKKLQGIADSCPEGPPAEETHSRLQWVRRTLDSFGKRAKG